MRKNNKYGMKNLELYPRECGAVVNLEECFKIAQKSGTIIVETIASWSLEGQLIA